MSLELDVEWELDGRPIEPHAAADAVEHGAEAFAEMVRAEVAKEAGKSLRRRSTTMWPMLTHFSRRRFRADDVAHSDGDIAITNTAAYARRVNNSQTGPGGKPNRNHRAAQRTIERDWAKLLARAVRRARASFDDWAGG